MGKDELHHLSMQDLLYIHSRVLDSSGNPLHGRDFFTGKKRARRIAEHLANCALCRQRAARSQAGDVSVKMESQEMSGHSVGYRPGLWQRYARPLAVAAALLIAVGSVTLYLSTLRAPSGMVMRSQYAESQFTVRHKNAPAGLVRMAPFSEIKLPENHEHFHRVRISEGSAEITLDHNAPESFDIAGDKGVVRVFWPGRNAAVPERVLRFRITDRDESRGSPDFFVKVLQGTLAVQTTSSGKTEFNPGEVFTVSHSSLVSATYE